jgi:2-C-methyl-D-erythritol 4-phosphate cytidylyltransferase
MPEQNKSPATGSPRFWALLPAAGSGLRMRSAIPKQYLPLAGATVVEHSLYALLQHPRIEAAVVVLQQADRHWQNIRIRHDKPVWLAHGGEERYQSVLNGLHTLQVYADSSDWVVVHDAARPCLHPADLDRLIGEIEYDDVGGLLASPVRDTMKRAGATARVTATESREGLWHALTPQIFRMGLLRQALSAVLERRLTVTDEAAAIELLGLAPKLVQGSYSNIKITLPEDIALAEFYLARIDQTKAKTKTISEL